MVGYSLPNPCPEQVPNSVNREETSPLADPAK